MFYIYLYIIAIIIFWGTESCLPSNRNSLKQSHDTIYPHHAALIEEGTYAPLERCNYTLLTPKKIINPYKKELQNIVQQKPFGNFCLKCSACLAVADQISKIVNKTIEDFKMSIISYNVTEKLIDDLDQLCEKGFRNYDLRKFQEMSFVTDKLDCTEHVNSVMDGGWTTKLRDLCKLYSLHIDFNNLSKDYERNTNEFFKILCSGHGVFRDCHNIEYKDFSENIGLACDTCNCI